MSDSISATSFIPFPDQPRQLKFTLSSVRLFRIANGGVELWKMRLPGPDGIAALLDNEVLTRIVWAGLLHLDRNIKYEKVELMLEKYLDANPETGISELYGIISEAFEESGLFGLRTRTLTKGAVDDAVVVPND